MPVLAMATKDRLPRLARRGHVLASSPILHSFPAPTICTLRADGETAHAHRHPLCTPNTQTRQDKHEHADTCNRGAHIHMPTRQATDPDAITHGPSSHLRLCFQPPVQTGTCAQPHLPLRVHEQTRTCADPDTRVRLVDKQTCISRDVRAHGHMRLHSDLCTHRTLSTQTCEPSGVHTRRHGSRLLRRPLSLMDGTVPHCAGQEWEGKRPSLTQSVKRCWQGSPWRGWGWGRREDVEAVHWKKGSKQLQSSPSRGPTWQHLPWGL